MKEDQNNMSVVQLREKTVLCAVYGMMKMTIEPYLCMFSKK